MVQYVRKGTLQSHLEPLIEREYLAETRVEVDGTGSLDDSNTRIAEAADGRQVGCRIHANGAWLAEFPSWGGGTDKRRRIGPHVAGWIAEVAVAHTVGMPAGLAGTGWISGAEGGRHHDAALQ